jgi:uncharacterized alkaline shock family protein YloU
MDDHSLIAADVLSRYAGDAAREVEGVAGLAESPLGRGKGVAISGDNGRVAVEVHLELEWGRSAIEVAEGVQQRVAEYLERMTDVTVTSVDVIVDSIGQA